MLLRTLKSGNTRFSFGETRGLGLYERKEFGPYGESLRFWKNEGHGGPATKPTTVVRSSKHPLLVLSFLTLLFGTASVYLTEKRYAAEQDVIYLHGRPASALEFLDTERRLARSLVALGLLLGGWGTARWYRNRKGGAESPKL
jgi:hypothetical protein